MSTPLIVDWLLEIGPTEPAAMGAGVIGWRTLDAWCNRVGVDLSPWQSRLLRRLSGDWLKESDRARKTGCPPPWTARPTEENWKAMERDLEDLFDRLG